MVFLYLCSACERGDHANCEKGNPAPPGVYGGSKCKCFDASHKLPKGDIDHLLAMTPSPQSNEQLCPKCGQSWEEHDFGVPSPYCPDDPAQASPQSNDAPDIDHSISQEFDRLAAELEQAKRELAALDARRMELIRENAEQVSAAYRQRNEARAQLTDLTKQLAEARAQLQFALQAVPVIDELKAERDEAHAKFTAHGTSRRPVQRAGRGYRRPRASAYHSNRPAQARNRTGSGAAPMRRSSAPHRGLFLYHRTAVARQGHRRGAPNPERA